MNFKTINLKHLKGRKEALQNIKRYIHFITPIMYYRTNLLIHSQRVLGHLEQALPDILETYGNDFDVEFARTLALVHDDAEIITGDVQLYEKEKMSEEELQTLAKEEEQAIPNMIQKYGETINGYPYKKLLQAAKTKNSIEAQFVSFCDKFDGAGEAWHEIFAGNKRFCIPAGGHQGTKGGYVRRLNIFPKKYPLMKPFFKKHPEYLPKPYDFKKRAAQQKPHTEKSIKEKTDYEPYNKWKQSVIKHEGTKKLTTQKEFEKE